LSLDDVHGVAERERLQYGNGGPIAAQADCDNGAHPHVCERVFKCVKQFMLIVCSRQGRAIGAAQRAPARLGGNEAKTRQAKFLGAGHGEASSTLLRTFFQRLNAGQSAGKFRASRRGYRLTVDLAPPALLNSRFDAGERVVDSNPKFLLEGAGVAPNAFLKFVP